MLLGFIGLEVDRTYSFASLSSSAHELQDVDMKDMDMDSLSAPHGTILPVVDTKDLYIRAAYKDLYDTILATFEN
ncbi:hypothetical protein BGZ97_010338, partial [Linnemannia gamsii]